MVNKKLIVLAILLVSLLTVSAVNATDNNATDVVGAEETTDEVVSIENQEILRGNNVGTFTDLAGEIANATGQLNLTRNYTYNEEEDSVYHDGVIIDEGIEINGNGFTINGNNQARIFKIQASNVIINNITFVNGYTSDGMTSEGGAILLGRR